MAPVSVAGPRLRARRAHTLWLALLLLAPAGQARADSWWGRDKALHFTVTFALGGGGYQLSGFAFEKPQYKALAGAGLALAVGAGKEIADATGSGDASAKDMTWNAVGAATGVLVGYAIDRLFLRSDTPPPNPRRAPPGPPLPDAAQRGGAEWSRMVSVP